jgi:hypothetical protein
MAVAAAAAQRTPANDGNIFPRAQGVVAFRAVRGGKQQIACPLFFHYQRRNTLRHYAEETAEDRAQRSAHDAQTRQIRLLQQH